MAPKFLLFLLLLCLWASVISSHFAYRTSQEPFHHSNAEEVPCSDYTDCLECIKSNVLRVVRSQASPIKDVCQWCRKSGSCVNITETTTTATLEPAPNKAPNKETCERRCLVKSLDMCPPATLLCGSLGGCMNCTNHSYCDFCESTQQCFNPCGDDHAAPIPVHEAPTTPPMHEIPTASPDFAPPDAEPVHDEEPTTTPTQTLWRNRGFYLEAPFQCESCVWSTQGQCKTAEFCASKRSCGECTANPSCGWCGNNIEGKCLVAGADKQPCSGASCKYWSYGNCEVACNSHSDCEACIQDREAQCSWCAGGTLNGRKTSFCGTAKVAHRCEATFTNACPQCGRVDSCSACLKRPNCGFCAQKVETLSSCVEGNPLGPYDPSDCITSTDPAVGWIKECQPWNTTTPLAPHVPPHHSPPPVAPPISPVPVQPPPVHPAPVNPPTTPPVIPEPINSPTTEAPQKLEPSPSEPVASPKAPVPRAAPKESPAKMLEPYIKEIDKMYNIGFIIGGSVSGAVVIIGGVLWFKLHASATHRYRAIG